MVSAHSSEARRPVSSRVRISARSRFPVERRIVKRRRSVVFASWQNSQALSSASISSLVNGSTGASSKRGAGMAFMGLGMPSSALAQVEEGGQRHPAVAERLGSQGLVAARHATRLVVGTQPGQVAPPVLRRDATDVHVAHLGEPRVEVVLVTFERAGAEGFRRLMLQEAVDGLDKLQARWSSVHRITLLFWGLPNRPSPGQEKHRSLAVYGVI